MDISQIGKSLKKSKELYEEIDVIYDELYKYVGMPIETPEGKLGFISNFDYEIGKVVVKFGLRISSDYSIKFYNYDSLINGELKFA